MNAMIFLSKRERENIMASKNKEWATIMALKQEAQASGKQNQNVADFFSSLLGTSGTV